MTKITSTITAGKAELAKMLPVTTCEIGSQEVNSVSGRALHSFLGSKKDFSTWMADHIKGFGFLVHQDFEIAEGLSSPNSGSTKSRPQVTKEYLVSMPMAKELAMVQRTAKGKEARLYFLECERQVLGQAHGFKAPQSLAEALRLALELEEERASLASKVETLVEDMAVLEPLAAIAQAITQAQDEQSFDAVAKIIGTGQNRLFALLRTWEWIKPYSTLPYQDQVDNGNFVVLERLFQDAHKVDRIQHKTLITGKGLVAIKKRMAAEASAPLIRPQHRF